jgi:signal transduction histidine kinase/CheY-like chemotaxis protein
MAENHDWPGKENAARTTVLWAVAASIATALTTAYAFGLWGDVVFPGVLGQPSNAEFGALERARFAAISAAFGLVSLLPLMTVLFATSREKTRLMRELEALKARPAAPVAPPAPQAAGISRAAKTADKDQLAFLAAISHELRTPMNSVIGLSDILARSTLSARQRRFVDSIRHSSRSVLERIDDILDSSKPGTGHIALRETDTNLRALIGEIVPALAQSAQQKNLEFSLEIGKEVPTLVRADGRRLRKVLTDLLTRIITFTQHGGVNVEVSFKPSGGGDGELRVRVLGEAKGISESDRKRILQECEEGDGGLTIARKLIGLMGGTLQAESGKSEGFSLTLPMAISDAGAAAPANSETLAIEDAGSSTESSTLPQYGLAILLVEDSPVNREVALEHLSSLGCGADVAVDGLEAIEAFERKTYDIILMDCQMPRCDGYQATGRIRKLEGEKNAARAVPIVALTAHAMPGDREKCLNAGMSDYIAKPYALEDLIKCFDRWCPETVTAPSSGPAVKAHEMTEKTPTDMPHSAHGGSPLDSAAANALRTLKPVLWGRLCKAFLTQAGPARQSLPVALAGDDFETVKAVAHSFKSACANIGALELSELARRLETSASAKDKAACAQYGAKFEADMARLCDYLETDQSTGQTAAAKAG